MEPDIRTATRILVCLRYGIGDLIMQLPALEALRAAATGARMTGLAAHPAVELLQGDPRFDRVACVQDMGFGHLGEPGRDADRAGFADWLRRERFDLIIDPSHTVICLQAILYAAGVPILDITPEIERTALARTRSGAEALNEAARLAWGIRAGGAPTLAVTREDRRWADGFLDRNGLTGAALLGLSGGASSPLKQWPLARLAAAAVGLGARFGLKLLLFDTADEPATRALLPQLTCQAVRASGLHLKHLAALLERCRMVICNDTGLMHLAAACGTRVVAVFGPTCERIYRPPGAEGVSSGIACAHRRTDAFGPPECVLAGRCLIGPESCVASVPADPVVERVERALTA